MKISVVVPIFNEELAIAENVRAIVKALNDLGRDWELVLVNDGSRDKTLEIITGLAKENSKIKVVSYTTNRGRGHALKTGFAAATGDYVIATESDLNWGTEIFGNFVRELDKGDADIIVASPHMKGGRMENVPFSRWLLSYLGNKIFSLAFPGKMTMCTGMTRAYKKEVLDSLDLESDDKELHIEILYKALDLGFTVKEIPAILRWKKPEKGVIVRKSHFKYKAILKHLLLSFGVKPFLLFGGLGFGLVGIGSIIGIYLLVLWLGGEAIGARPILFTAVLLIVVGFQVLVFGFLANQNREIKRQLARVQKAIKESSEKS
ncbi:MAG: glycosyltransferase family 2 protein [Candidatus Pacebacteria bacterium]|nr:glycosyltransferase family 2 protein [Candidatus Paceibacterota bacterium]